MKIAILDDYQDIARELADWDSLGAEVDVLTEHIADSGALVERLAGCEVVVAMRERTQLPGDVLRRLPELRLIVSLGGSRNPAIDLKATAELGIVVSHTGYLPHPTAEHTWALILAAMRGIPDETRSVREGGWQTSVGRSLQGATLGVVGLGRLGGRIARIGQAFGMRTLAWSANLTQEKADEHDVLAVPKEQLLAESDVVTIHQVLSSRTRGLIGAPELAAMKPDAWLVNTSRGPIIDEAALLDALHERRIGGAALDVYDTEPLPADHPLRTAPNTVLTPHIGYVVRDLYEVFYRDAVADIAAYQVGEPIRVMSL
ncbi:D-2-hydroxyacid dehydrogenase family protein [Prauserella halophila]|nr:D-2-hydroxyacid dehydrogenase family protein [Prauserella halophila]MCP2238734.1 Lactate dehydrogenase [Prauserella halophila]